MTALKDIAFAEIPSTGLAVTISGQRYDLLAIEPHIRRDGSGTHLGVWHTECAVCGRSFVIRSPALSMPGTKRCEEHRQPGRAVSNRASGQRQWAERYGSVSS